MGPSAWAHGDVRISTVVNGPVQARFRPVPCSGIAPGATHGFVASPPPARATCACPCTSCGLGPGTGVGRGAIPGEAPRPGLGDPKVRSGATRGCRRRQRVHVRSDPRVRPGGMRGCRLGGPSQPWSMPCPGRPAASGRTPGGRRAPGHPGGRVPRVQRPPGIDHPAPLTCISLLAEIGSRRSSRMPGHPPAWWRPAFHSPEWPLGPRRPGPGPVRRMPGHRTGSAPPRVLGWTAPECANPGIGHARGAGPHRAVLGRSWAMADAPVGRSAHAPTLR